MGAEQGTELHCTPNVGGKAHYYPRLSEAGLAPKIIEITDECIVTVRYQTLEDWLTHTSRESRGPMKQAIKRLLLAVHTIGICHRDVHIGNIVLAEDGRPLLVDPDFATKSVNEHCYDLEGPTISEIAVPKQHIKAGGGHEHGIWWGSPVRWRGLEDAFGLP